MAFLTTEALADTPRAALDSLLLPWDSLTTIPDSLAFASGSFLSDIALPLAAMALSAAVFALLYFVRSK